MNERNQQYSDEKRLWRQFAAQDQAQPVLSDLEPNLLAVYLDGKADPAQIEQIESLMASNPALLEEIIELRRLQAAGPALVCQALLHRAKALAAPQQPAPAVVGRTGLWQRLQWAAVAAVVALACLGGYTAGRSTLQSRHYAQASVTSQLSLDLDELLSDPVLAMLIPSNGANGDEQ